MESESSIEKLLRELREESDKNPRTDLPTQEEYAQAAREINAYMEQVAIETRAYFAYSKEAARHAYITF